MILSLVVQLYADAAGLSGVTDTLARTMVPLSAILIPAGFFFSLVGRERTSPNRWIALLCGQRLALVVAYVTALGIGLLTVSDSGLRTQPSAGLQTRPCDGRRRPDVPGTVRSGSSRRCSGPCFCCAGTAMWPRRPPRRLSSGRWSGGSGSGRAVGRRLGDHDSDEPPRRVLRRRVAVTDPGAAADAPDPDTALDLWRSVAALPLRQQQVVVLHYRLGLSTAEAAIVMRCAEGSVRGYLTRARDALRTRLQEEPDGTRPTR